MLLKAGGGPWGEDEQGIQDEHRPGGEERLGQERIQTLRFPTTSGSLSAYGPCVSGLTSRLLLPLWAAASTVGRCPMWVHRGVLLFLHEFCTFFMQC